MADKLIIDGVEFDIPDEDDWELGELAEFGRLRDKWGDMGSTIALVWICKHRADPAFTVEQASRIKVSQVAEEKGDDADPLGVAETSSNGSDSLSRPSSSEAFVIHAGSGVP